MRALVQRVSSCAVQVEDQEISRIGKGLLVLLGISRSDGDAQIEFMVNKIINLRVFDDQEGVMNLSLSEVSGELMVVSQFTLYGDARKGRRPSYIRAAAPERAEVVYEAVCEAFSRHGFIPARGVFGAHMAVELVNDGPVTLLLESPPL